MNIKAAMPVKGYLKKYVLWKENIEEGDILEIGESQGEISWVLSGILTGKIKATQNGPKNIPEVYDDEIIFKIPVLRFRANRLFFPIDGIRYFNTYLYRDFHETLLVHILANKEFGITEVDTIYRWIDMLGIIDDISFDALKKASYRMRKSKDLGVFRSGNSISAETA